MYVKTPSSSLRDALHRLLERVALRHPLGEVDGDDLGVALGLEAVAGSFQAALPLVVVRELPVVHHGDIRERIRPVGVRLGDVNVGLGRHPRVADGVGADELVEAVVVGNRLLRRRGP